MAVQTQDSSQSQTKWQQKLQELLAKSRKRNEGVDEDDFLYDDELLSCEPGEEQPQFDETSSPHNPYTRRRFHKNAAGGRGELSRYVPHKERIRQASIAQTPHFLFRTYHEESAGINREGFYQSQAMASGFGEQDFFQLSDQEIKISLNEHISQMNGVSHWISFTDSITTLLGRAGQFHAKGKEDIRIDIVDTTKIKNLPIIVHAYPMLRGYRVCVDQNEVKAKKMLGSSYTELLVWDHIEAESCSVSLSQLLQLGLLEVLPELLSTPKKALQTCPLFKQPNVLRQRLYGLEEKISQNEAVRDAYTSGPWNQWKRRAFVGAFPRKNKNLPPLFIREIYDPRRHIESHELNKYRRVTSCFRKPRFQLVMLVALLSMKTNRVYHDSIVEELALIRDDEGMFNDLIFLRTVANTPRKPEVERYQEIFASVLKARGTDRVQYVTEVKRDLMWLDLDPKVVLEDTSDEEGDEEKSAGLSVKLTGLSAPSKLPFPENLMVGDKHHQLSELVVEPATGRPRKKRKVEHRRSRKCLADSGDVDIFLVRKPILGCNAQRCMESNGSPQVSSTVSAPLVQADSTSTSTPIETDSAGSTPPLPSQSKASTLPDPAEHDARQTRGFEWSSILAKELNANLVVAGPLEKSRSGSCGRFLAWWVE